MIGAYREIKDNEFTKNIKKSSKVCNFLPGWKLFMNFPQEISSLFQILVVGSQLNQTLLVFVSHVMNPQNTNSMNHEWEFTLLPH